MIFFIRYTFILRNNKATFLFCEITKQHFYFDWRNNKATFKFFLNLKVFAAFLYFYKEMLALWYKEMLVFGM